MNAAFYGRLNSMKHKAFEKTAQMASKASQALVLDLVFAKDTLRPTLTTDCYEMSFARMSHSILCWKNTFQINANRLMKPSH